jgi:hypothetical protein
VRAGYWFGSLLEVGLGVGVFYFRLDVPRQHVTATAAFSGHILDEPMSVAVAGRVRIPSADPPASSPAASRTVGLHTILSTRELPIDARLRCLRADLQ